MKLRRNRIALLIIILIFNMIGSNIPLVHAQSNKITLNKTSVKLAVGSSITLKANGASKGKKITWKSGNSKVASVQNGVVKGKAVGTALITASSGNNKASCKVTVYQPAKSVKLSTAEYIEVGDSFQVKAEFLPENTTYRELEWSVISSYGDDTVKQIKKNEFKAVEEGTAVIAAYQKDTKKTYQLKVTVHYPLGSFHLECNNKTVTALNTYVGCHLNVNAVFDGGNGEGVTESDFQYSVKNPSIAAIDEEGSITGLQEGNTSIIATAKNGKSVECKLKVEKRPAGILLDQWLSSDFKQDIGSGGYNYTFGEADDTKIMPLPEGGFAVCNCTYTRKNTLAIRYMEYTEDYRLEEEKNLELPFTEYGGIFQGTDGYYYLAVGQKNYEEDKNKIVYAIIKLSREFKEVGRCNITTGESNTTVPYEVSGCSMDMNGNLLVVNTARRQCISEDDGLNHQSSIAFMIDTESMKLILSPDDMYYIKASHSFQQIVKFDSDNLVYVDHGDANPRTIRMETCFHVIQNIKNNISFDNVDTNFLSLLDIQGDSGENYTGTKVVGLELGKKHNLVAGTSIPHDTLTGNILDYETRNVFLSVVSKDGTTSEFKWLTNYKEGSHISTDNLRFVKINNDNYALIYQINYEDRASIGLIIIDSDGNIITRKELEGSFAGRVNPIYYQGALVWLESSLWMDNTDEFVYDGREGYTNYFMKLYLP